MSQDADPSRSPAAGPGVFIPPPLVYLAGLGLGWWLQGKYAFAVNVGFWHEIAGAGLVLLSVAGVLWAAGRFGRAGTPVVPVQPATALVTDGPFRHTRNPMYLSLGLGYLGVTLLMNSLWPLVFLPGVWAVMNYWVIPREERHLDAVFGEAYANYRRRVRRWI